MQSWYASLSIQTLQIKKNDLRLIKYHASKVKQYVIENLEKENENRKKRIREKEDYYDTWEGEFFR